MENPQEDSERPDAAAAGMLTLCILEEGASGQQKNRKQTETLPSMVAMDRKWEPLPENPTHHGMIPISPPSRRFDRMSQVGG